MSSPNFDTLYEDADRQAARILARLQSVVGEIREMYAAPDALAAELLSDAISRRFNAVPEVQQMGIHGEAFGAFAALLFGADFAGQYGSYNHPDACGTAEEGFKIAQVFVKALCDPRDGKKGNILRDFLLAAVAVAHDDYEKGATE